MVDINKLTSVREGARLLGVLPYIEAEVSKILYQIDTKAYRLLDADDLDPDLALQLWIEKRSAVKLLKRFEQIIAVGQATGAEIAHEL